MQIVRDYKEVPASARGGALTIGNFDGVHRGHQAVIAVVKERASQLGASAGAMLFDPHPRAFFQPGLPQFTLTPIERRLELLAALGLDFVAVLPFDAALAGLSAEAFVEQVLVDGFELRHLSVGHDFRFGKGRAGDGSFLKAQGERHGFGVSLLDAQNDSHGAFSSSRIRRALREGDVAGAARQLGRNWSIDGPVIAGAGRGGGLGYPTANLALPPGCELAHGIYAARVWVDGAPHHGAAYFGKRPAFDNGPASFETFLIGFDAGLYGKTIRVELVDFIRADRGFADAQSLKAQMDLDVAEATRRLGLDDVRR